MSLIRRQHKSIIRNLSVVASNRGLSIRVEDRSVVSRVETTNLNCVTLRRASERNRSSSARGNDNVGKEVILIEAASKTRLERDRGLADAENLRGSIVLDRADEINSRASSALSNLRAESELAVTLRTKVVVDVITGTSEDTVTLDRDNCGSSIDVVVQSSRGIDAFELINRLTSSSELTSWLPERIAIGIALDDTFAEPVLGVSNESQRL
jgi:hypothetical protein